MPRLFQITSNYFCAGFEYSGRFAPIIQYMKHWDLQRIYGYCAAKRWKIEEINASTAHNIR